MENLKQHSKLYIFGIAFIFAAIIFGIWVAMAYGSVDAAYLAKSIQFPNLYPISEAERLPNLLLGTLVGSVFIFFSAVSFGLDEIICKGKGSEEVGQISETEAI